MGFAQMMEIFENLPEKTRKAFIVMMEEIEKRFDMMERMATKDEMNSLRDVVAELAEAQRRTEERVNQLAQRMDELAEAQRRTEERVNQLAQRMDELAEAQRRTEERVNQLAQRMDELAEAQRRTEERVKQLAQRMDELAEAQRRTEETLNALLKRQRIYEQKVDGLSHSFGFLLEDRAIQSLPEVLEREGVEVIGSLRSLEIELDRVYEINIYGLVEEDGVKKVLLGECKSRASKKELQRFLKVVDKVKEYVMAKEKVGEIFLVFVVHRISSRLRREFEEVGVRVYESYELRI